MALDAARANLPVTVIGYDLDLSCYAPLKAVSTIDQLRKFMHLLSEESDRNELVELSRLFVEKHVLNGDAMQRIITSLVQAIDLQEVN